MTMATTTTTRTMTMTTTMTMAMTMATAPMKTMTMTMTTKMTIAFSQVLLDYADCGNHAATMRCIKVSRFANFVSSKFWHTEIKVPTLGHACRHSRH